VLAGLRQQRHQRRDSAQSAQGRRGLFTWRGAPDFMAEHQVSAFSIVNYQQASWAGKTNQVAIPDDDHFAVHAFLAGRTTPDSCD
jgi:hypothetical protein